ncbi:hypothetical protein RUND412_009596 [Rhizina undulata]
MFLERAAQTSVQASNGAKDGRIWGRISSIPMKTSILKRGAVAPNWRVVAPNWRVMLQKMVSSFLTGKTAIPTQKKSMKMSIAMM